MNNMEIYTEKMNEQFRSLVYVNVITYPCPKPNAGTFNIGLSKYAPCKQETVPDKMRIKICLL